MIQQISSQYKQKYFEKISHFYSQLMLVGLELKDEEPSERSNLILKHIIRLNSIIKSHQNNSHNTYNLNEYGILLPLHQKFKKCFQPNLIVNILENNFTFYETKQRVPFKLVLECIDPNYLQ